MFEYKKYLVFCAVFFFLYNVFFTELDVEAAEIETFGNAIMQETEVINDSLDGDMADTENNKTFHENNDTSENVVTEDMLDTENITVSGNNSGVLSNGSSTFVDNYTTNYTTNDTVSGNSSVGSPATIIPPTVVNNYATYNTTLPEEEKQTFLEKPFEEYTVAEGYLFLIFLACIFICFIVFIKWRTNKWRI